MAVWTTYHDKTIEIYWLKHFFQSYHTRYVGWRVVRLKAANSTFKTKVVWLTIQGYDRSNAVPSDDQHSQWWCLSTTKEKLKRSTPEITHIILPNGSPRVISYMYRANTSKAIYKKGVWMAPSDCFLDTAIKLPSY